MCYSGLKNGLLPLCIASQRPGDYTRLYEVFAAALFQKARGHAPEYKQPCVSGGIVSIACGIVCDSLLEKEPI